MRTLIAALLACVLFACFSCSSESGTGKPAANGKSDTKAPGTREPVLVELFTSEGCGNCPPADKMLSLMETQQPFDGADVITLGYHVDYFNDRGWKDEYSSADYTKRQRLYSLRLGVESVYTPQMVVDGRAEFIGSDGAKAKEIIGKAADEKKPNFAVKVDGQTARVTFTDLQPHDVATAVVAAAEDGLTSDVNAGNNRGKKLSHVSVVRKLQGFGKVPQKATEFSGAVDLPSDPAWNKEKMRYIVYLQEDQSGRIIGVGRVK